VIPDVGITARTDLTLLMTALQQHDSDDPQQASPEATGPSPRADRITALLLIAFGAAVTFESWRMPRMSEFGANIWSAPGIVPGMVGVLISLMGTALYLRARGKPISTDPTDHPAGGWRRGLTVFVLCILFAGGLVSRVPFWIAAFAFITSFILLFDREDRALDSGVATLPPRRIALAIVIALSASLIITWVFEDIFLVRLP